MRYIRRTHQGGQILSPPTEPYKARATRGSSAIEFALIAPIFFLLLAGMIDFGRLFFVQLTMQDALRQAARFASTGQHLGGTDPLGNPYTRETSINQIIFNEAAAAGIPAASVNVIVSSTQGGSGNAGNPMDTVTISVQVTMNLLTGYIAHYFAPNGQYVFTLRMGYKNEAFSPRCTTAPYTGC
jgi:Flp pilus assembly protein TadG